MSAQAGFADRRLLTKVLGQRCYFGFAFSSFNLKEKTHQHKLFTHQIAGLAAHLILFLCIAKRYAHGIASALSPAAALRELARHNVVDERNRRASKVASARLWNLQGSPLANHR